MAYTFKDLQDEVARRATTNQGGTTFNVAVKNLINTSLFRLAREAKWRVLRREATFDTVTSYTEGSGGGTFTNASKSVTMTGATLLTDDVQPGRLVSLSGSNKVYTILTITGETTFTVDINYDGTTTAVGTYSIKPQQVYNVPIQASHKLFLWHREYGYPIQISYTTDQNFYDRGIDDKTTGIPEAYRMWGADMIVEQVKEASVITIVSSSASDTTQAVTVFGTVSGVPDFESITVNGTTAAAGSKSFSSVERVVKSDSTVGRITVTANTGNTGVTVIPVGDTTAGIMYRKIQLWPLPNTVFPMHVSFYKDPFRLVNDNDVHEMGQDFDEALILLATAKLKSEQNIKEGTNFFTMYRDEVKSIRRKNIDKVDFFPTLFRAKDSRGGFGRLGQRLHSNLLVRQVGSFFGGRTFR